MVTKITEVAIHYDSDLVARVIFTQKVTKSGWTIRHYVWAVALSRKRLRRIKRLIKALSSCPYKQQVILQYDGYLLIFER